MGNPGKSHERRPRYSRLMVSGEIGEACRCDGHADLAGSWVAVTGAGGLIGRSIVAELISVGANVIGVDRSSDRLDAVGTYDDGRVVLVQADVAEPSGAGEILEAIERAQAAHVVHAAGWQVPEGRERVPEADEWRSVFDVHVIGPALLTTDALQAMHSRGASASVVFLSSVHEHMVFGDPSYGTAKSALAGLVRELAALAADHGSRVNAIAPGHVAEPVVASPPSRLGRQSVSPTSVATAVRFLLCGHCSPHTTGATLTVDAGFGLNDLWARDQAKRRNWRRWT